MPPKKSKWDRISIKIRESFNQTVQDMEKSFDSIKPQVSAEPIFKKQKSAQVD
jgi:hypothetical protein